MGACDYPRFSGFPTTDETDKVVQPVRRTRLNEKQGTTPCTACWFVQNGIKRHDRGTMPVFRKSVGLSVVGREELWASSGRAHRPLSRAGLTICEYSHGTAAMLG